MKNNKVLVITGQYWPKPSANGACLDQLLKELFKKGYYCEVVSLTPFNEDYEADYCKVYPISIDSYSKRLTVIKRFISYLRNLYCFPLHSSKVLNEAISTCNDIIGREEISLVLCVQKPASCGYIGSRLKILHPNLKYILYELDSLTDNIDNFVSWRRFFRNRNHKLESVIYNSMDLILYLESHRRYYSNSKYDSYRSKSRCIDIPLIDIETYKSSKPSVLNDQIKLIYSGVLTKGNRTPDYLLSILNNAYKQGLITQMHFYSRGNCEELLSQLSETTMKGRLFVHGYVTKEELDLEVAESDILVSIGEVFNGKVYSFPSKIIYYMSMGKPILHIAPNKDDMCLRYLEKYPNALVLYQENDLQDNVTKFLAFVNKQNGSLVDFSVIKEQFVENTGQYTIETMFNFFKEEAAN